MNSGVFSRSISLTVTDCSFVGNTGYFNGGIYNNGLELTVSDSTFYGNTGGDYGGAIENWTTATITDCTISGNLSARGGGIWNAGSLTLDNPIVSGNTLLNGTARTTSTAESSTMATTSWEWPSRQRLSNNGLVHRLARGSLYPAYSQPTNAALPTETMALQNRELRCRTWRPAAGQ